MRLDPPFTPTVSGVDPSGMPIITRNPLAYTRTATGFTQAMASAQQNVSSKPTNYQPKAGSLLPRIKRRALECERASRSNLERHRARPNGRTGRQYFQ